MHDILPADMPYWQLLEKTVTAVFSSYGFEEIRVPVLEKTEVFTRAIGPATDVVEKEMYTFEDRNGDFLSLRPEGTAGIVRAALQNGLLYGSPLRLWHAGPMFRHERPQKGRTRQFHQAGAEVFGAEGPDVDTELLAMGERIWKRLGLQNIRLELNSLGNSQERTVYRQKLVEFLSAYSKELDHETLQRMQRNPLRVLDSKNEKVQAILENAPRLPDFLGEESRRHFEGVRRMLDRLNIEYTVNPRLVRGLDYYCHTVFEWMTSDLGAQGTVCAGGRYDGLIELQGGKPWPATGFAMGLERLVELVKQAGGVPVHWPHVYLVHSGPATQLEGFAIAEELREAIPTLRIVCNAGSGSFRSQFKRADRSGAALALVIGDDELDQRKVTIKHLREQVEQESMSREGLTAWMEHWLGEH